MPDPPTPPAVAGSDLRCAAAARSELALADAARHDGAMAQLLWCGLPQLLAVLEVNGRLRAVNPAWQHLLGLDAQQLRGQSFLGLVHADDQAAALQWLHRVTSGAGPAGFDGRWHCADGDHLQIHWTLALRDGLVCAAGLPAQARAWPNLGAGRPGAVAEAGTARTAGLAGTARKSPYDPHDPHDPHDPADPADPADLAAKLPTVSDACAAPAVAAQAVAAQARHQTLRTVARLTGGLSHNFNNLLQVLRNTLELIQQRPNEPRQVAAWAASALRIVDRGAQVTAQLLAFAGTQRLTPQTVQVAALLQGMHAGLLHLLGPQTPLQLELPAGGALATADAAQLELAVLNLARNAHDAMPQGGRLTISLSRAHVEDDPELATGDYVCIQVGDTGAGMSETVRQRAFEPFFTTKALGRGNGLGLSQVYGFAQQIGGAVRIDSHPAGPGTCVRLMLPAAALAPPLAAPDGAIGGAIGGPSAQAPAAAPWQPLVMVVVDDADRRQLLLSALNLLGYTRVQAVDAGTALQQIKKRPPDVVVLGLPARPVSADELARHARRLRPGVGVVRLDSLATAPQVPLDMDALAQAIGRAVAPPQP